MFIVFYMLLTNDTRLLVFLAIYTVFQVDFICNTLTVNFV